MYKCTVCGQETLDKPKKTFLGFNKIKCSKCGVKNTYPLGNETRTLMLVGTLLFGAIFIFGYTWALPAYEDYVRRHGMIFVRVTLIEYIKSSWICGALAIMGAFALFKDYLIRRAASGNRSSELSSSMLSSNQQQHQKHNLSDMADQLLNAAKGGSLSDVKALLFEGVDINTKNKNGETALILASLEGHLPIVRFLLKNGACIDTKAKDNVGGNNALICASAKGHIEIVQILLAAGADVNSRNQQGVFSLMFAAGWGHLQIVETLLANGANLNNTDNNGCTALINASHGGQISVVQALLSKGADVNAKDARGYTALIAASEKGHLPIIKELLSKGADVNAKTWDGYTALIFASNQGHSSIVETLLAAGADDYVKACEIQKMISEEAHKSFAEAHAKLKQLGYYSEGIELINDKPNLKAGSYWAILPLGTKFSWDRLDQVVYFSGPQTGQYNPARALEDLQKSVKWAESQDKQETMLRMGMIGAVKDGNLEAVKWLLAHGVDVNAKEADKPGWTPLLYAVENHRSDIVKILLERGADVNVEDSNGRTALIIASSLGNRDIVQALLAKGADVSKKDKTGLTALSHASEQLHITYNREYLNIIKLLKQDSEDNKHDQCINKKTTIKMGRGMFSIGGTDMQKKELIITVINNYPGIPYYKGFGFNGLAALFEDILRYGESFGGRNIVCDGHGSPCLRISDTKYPTHYILPEDYDKALEAIRIYFLEMRN